MKLSKLTKLFSIMLVIVLSLSMFACTTDNKDTEGTTNNQSGTTALPDYTIKAMLLSGPTGMSAAKLMSDITNKTSALKVEFEVAASPDIISGQIINGSIDIAAVPTNLASVLYNKTKGDVRVVAVSALGVLYLLEDGNTVTDIQSLKGKTVYVPGQGSNPEYILLHLLKKNGLEAGRDVTIDYTYASPDALSTAVLAGQAKIAVLPEPKVTAILTKKPAIRNVLDFTAEWDKVEEKGTLVQSCLVTTKKFATENKALLDAFLAEYESSINYVNESPKEASVLIQEAGFIPSAAMAEAAIPRCNLIYIDGEQMQSALGRYFEILFDANPASVGGALPDDGLYYKK